MLESFSEFVFIAQSSTIDQVGSSQSSFGFIVWFMFFVFSFCCIFPASIFFASIVVVKFINATSEIYEPDFLSRIWYRTILLTPKGLTSVFIAIVVILISIISIDFSVISTVGFFILIIFGILFFISHILNAIIFVQKSLARIEMIDSSINLKVINDNEPVRINIRLKIPSFPGFLIKLRLIVPKVLGGEIRSTNMSKNSDIFNFEVVLPRSKRGEHEIGPICIEYTDLLGFTAIQLMSFKKMKILIYPTIKSIKKINWLSVSEKYGDDAIVKKVINSDDFFDIREYQRGDDVRKMHWKLSAKTDKLMIRVPETTSVITGNFVLFIDNLKLTDNRGSYIEENIVGYDEILDRIIQISGSIIDFTLRHNKGITIFYYTSTSKVKKIIYTNTRREEWLKDLSQIKLENKTFNNKNMIYDILVNESKSASGLFIATSDIESKRYNFLDNAVNNSKIRVNVLFVNPASFLKSSKKRINKVLNIFGKMFLTSDYLKQFSFIDNLFYSKIDYKEIELDRLKDLEIQSQRVIQILSKKSFNSKIFNKDDDYIYKLEKEKL